jgi:hypothetical protein
MALAGRAGVRSDYWQRVAIHPLDALLIDGWSGGART